MAFNIISGLLSLEPPVDARTPNANIVDLFVAWAKSRQEYKNLIKPQPGKDAYAVFCDNYPVARKAVFTLMNMFKLDKALQGLVERKLLDALDKNWTDWQAFAKEKGRRGDYFGPLMLGVMKPSTYQARLLSPDEQVLLNSFLTKTDFGASGLNEFSKYVLQNAFTYGIADNTTASMLLKIIDFLMAPKQFTAAEFETYGKLIARIGQLYPAEGRRAIYSSVG